MPNIDDFWLDGERASDRGIICQDFITFDPPEARVETFEVPGRSGDVVYWDGGYKNLKGTIKAYTIGREAGETMAAVNDWLLSDPGYRRLETLHDTQHFRRARVTRAAQIQLRLGLLNSYQIELDCDPRRFLKSGETPLTLTWGQHLVNPTGFYARPLIQIIGHGMCAIRFNNIPADITGNNIFYLQLTSGTAMTTAYIDVEEHEVYDSAGNNLSSVLHHSEYFDSLQLKPGVNVLEFGQDDGTNGAVSATITPRWWTL